MKRLLSVLLLLSAIAALHAQNKRIAVSGYITDASSGETLLGAGVIAESGPESLTANGGRTGAVANTYGFYSLTLPGTGAYTLRFSYVGYEDRLVGIKLTRDTVLNISLSANATLTEATVTAQKDAGLAATKMSAIEIPVNAIKNMPALLGEADVLKTVQLLPGVQGGAEGFSGLYVRGGGPDENLLLLDGIPIYNAEHMMGIFSVFQPEAVKKVTLYKGSFPARYGGRVSSIIDVRTNDGNMNETHGSIGISAISDKIHIEGPIIKNKTTYSLSARGMHTILLEGLMKALKIPGNYYFYDLNAKLAHRFGSNDRIFLNVYHGLDNFYTKEQDSYSDNSGSSTATSYYNDKISLNWGNTVAALRWNHSFGSGLFSNATVAWNRYRMLTSTDIRQEMQDPEGKINKTENSFRYTSGMRDLNFKADFDYIPVPSHTIKFGGEYIFHTFVPETVTSAMRESEDGKVKMDTTMKVSGNSRITGHEVSVYAEDDFSIGPHITLNPGIRLALFNTLGKNYLSAEPRIAGKWSFGRGYALKAAYSRMSQYVHLLSSAQISLPIDLWVPITNKIPPETSDQYSLGLYYEGLKGWEFSLEGYYKDIHNVLEYRDGVMFLGSSSSWYDKVEAGNGRAMGVELFIEKTMGKTTGWIGYTLAKSDRIFPSGKINNGERFPYRYDRRHKINIVLNQKLGRKFDLSVTWNLSTGGTTTIPLRQTILVTPSGKMIQEDHIGSRNNYRLPASHTLNIGLNFHRKYKKRGEGIWNLSVYNVYNRMNPNFVLSESKRDAIPGTNAYSSEMRLRKVTILPILPTIGYTYKF